MNDEQKIQLANWLLENESNSLCYKQILTDYQKHLLIDFDYQKVTSKYLIDLVTDYFNISQYDFYNAKRDRLAVKARSAFCYILLFIKNKDFRVNYHYHKKYDHDIKDYLYLKKASDSAVLIKRAIYRSEMELDFAKDIFTLILKLKYESKTKSDRGI